MAMGVGWSRMQRGRVWSTCAISIAQCDRTCVALDCATRMHAWRARTDADVAAASVENVKQISCISLLDDGRTRFKLFLRERQAKVDAIGMRRNGHA